MSLPFIAEKLAGALRNMPCTCKPIDSWPAFANKSRVSKCARCEALELYDAHISIVQLPKGKP